MDKMLSDECLKRPLTDVFELVSRIGKGSYGNVYKARLAEQPLANVAIKQIPIESDLFEIIREISIMQQCSDSDHIVKYYGSYFHDSDLWIVMEYCETGSVSDIMKILMRTLDETQIAAILHDTLRGLEYLHLKKKIHRDIKACNILLDRSGRAKLADFGVAGQLSDCMSKRNTVIGTPYWMAPEIIQEIGYDCSADSKKICQIITVKPCVLTSWVNRRDQFFELTIVEKNKEALLTHDVQFLGITCIEMFEGKPPYADIHPMRAIFMIPTKPAPTLKDVSKCSSLFLEFMSKCLVKKPNERPSASELLGHEFIQNSKPSTIALKNLVEKILELKDQMNSKEPETVITFDQVNSSNKTSESDQLFQTAEAPQSPQPASEENFATLIDKNTLSSSSSSSLFHSLTRRVGQDDENKTDKIPLIDPRDVEMTMKSVNNDTLNSMATMVINDDEISLHIPIRNQNEPNLSPDNDDNFPTQDDISGTMVVIETDGGNGGGGGCVVDGGSLANQVRACIQREVRQLEKLNDVLNGLSKDEIKLRLMYLDEQMEREIEKLKVQYENKRNTILEIIEMKKKNSQIF